MENTSEKTILTKKQKFIQFIKFVGFSAGAGIIEAVSFTILNEFIGAELWVCDVISISLSVLFNFTLNRKYTFKAASNIPLSMSLVALFYLIFTPAGAQYILWLVSLGVNEYVAKFSKMVINLILEFLYCKFVVYRKSENTNNLAKRKNKNRICLNAVFKAI